MGLLENETHKFKNLEKDVERIQGMINRKSYADKSSKQQKKMLMRLGRAQAALEQQRRRIRQLTGVKNA